MLFLLTVGVVPGWEAVGRLVVYLVVSFGLSYVVFMLHFTWPVGRRPCGELRARV